MDSALAPIAVGTIVAAVGLTGGYLLHRQAKSVARETRQATREELERARKSLDEQAQTLRESITKQELRLQEEERKLDERRAGLDKRSEDLAADQRQVWERAEALERSVRAAETELQRIAGLSKTEARDQFLAQIEAEFAELGRRRAKEVELSQSRDAERRAKKILLDVMQRSVVDYVTEATLAVIELPSEDMKGRIIGREGRNIRAFEQTTGVDLIIDETPEAVVISCFDPVRREIARLTLMNLMLDGRIHPGRIEELHEKATQEVNRMILEAGERAADRANLTGLSPRIIEMMGRLRFRTSYAQNVLDHSVEVARLAENLAHELGLNAELTKRAAFLHDIGKALGPEYEGPHAITGMEFLRSLGEKDAVLHAVGAHHHDIEPTTAEAILVIIADTISASRPGARRENLDAYLKRLTSLETLANSFPGVERSFAVQAGREVRLIVKPDELDDLAATRLAAQVARRIEQDLEYPGQIKVTVIRETRITDIAK